MGLTEKTPKLKAGNRQTETAPLPRGWDLRCLGDLATVRYGKAKPKETGNIPAVGSGGIYSWTSKALIDYPTLVVGRKGTAGKVWLQEYPSWPSDTTFYLEWRTDKVDYRFVYHALQTQPLSGEHAKTTLPSLSKPDLENHPLALPPLPEQEAIAHVLRTVQQATETTEQVIEASRELKRSLMNHFFTYGPVPVDEAEQVPLKETEIGSVPEHWKVLRLEKAANITSGGTPSRKRPELWNGEIPWVKTGEVNYNTITSSEEKISEQGLEESSARMIPAGTLLVAMYGQGVTRGRVAMLGIDAAINQACAAISPMKGLDSRFLYHFFIYSYEAIRNLGHGAHQKNLSATLLKALPVPCPLPSEQEDIVRFLDAVEQKILVEVNRKQSLSVLFKTLLHNLMSGKLRVNHLDLRAVEEMV
jgi:type I restriction enzyme S subunit